ncbi:MAG: hypothetical protein JW715_15535 [Sedimentisphaerales bacterium]|nr:hypothetical protein [Sedimentisphaerales bacterium]
MAGVKSSVLKLILILMSLAITTSCSVKTGIHNLNGSHHQLDIDEEPLRYWEAEGSIPNLCNEYMTLTLGIGYNSGKEDGRIEIHDDKWLPEIKTYMWDVHLGARLFPLGASNEHLVPYIGGGVGYFEYEMDRRTEGDYEYVYSDEGYDYFGLDVHNDTLAHGYYPYLATGLYLPLDKKCALQMEFRYDFDKEYKQYDMAGYQITLGVAFMFH